MKQSASLLFGLILLAACAGEASAQDGSRETMIDEQFSVKEGGKLEVVASDADVKVSPGKANDVHVRVVLEGRDMELAREYFERQRITVTQDGNTVRVASDPVRGDYGWRDGRNHPDIQILITAPEVFDADIRSSDGDLTLERLRGDVHLQTSDGDVSTGELDGGTIEIRTSDGDIHAGPLSGERIEVVTSDGDVVVDDAAGDRVTLRTSDGDIRAGDVSGDAEINTSDGSISVVSFRGPSLSVRTSDGSIRVERLAAGSTKAHTSDGEISLGDADGDIEARTSSGNIRLELNDARTIDAKTSDGDVMIAVRRGHRADISLSGEEVRVARAHSFEGEIKEERADGHINGGGPMIRARTSNGTVTVDVR